MANGCSPISQSTLTSRGRRARPQLSVYDEHGAAADPETERVCWGLSIGAAGMLSQMRGLSDAVGLRFEEKRTRLRRMSSWLPMSIVPRARWAFRGGELLDAVNPPRLVIACGRHGVIPLICFKRLWGERVFTVFIQHPRVELSNFDLVLAPEHDGLTGSNVISTRGALHHINREVLESARETELAAKLAGGTRPLVAVLLGGPNRYYGFTARDAFRLIDSLRNAVQRDGARLLVIPSRRTPRQICSMFSTAFGAPHLVWEGEGANPYLAALAVCDHVVVTGDSVSMTTEATATGRPVHVAHLKERIPARRFRRFHESFERAGLTRAFDGRLPTWKYVPPDDTAAVAARIRERIGSPCQS